MKVSLELFSKSVYGLLRKHNIYTLEEIEELGIIGMFRLRGIGTKAIKEISFVLRAAGYKFEAGEINYKHEAYIIDIFREIKHEEDFLPVKLEPDVRLEACSRWVEVSKKEIEDQWAIGRVYGNAEEAGLRIKRE